MGVDLWARGDIALFRFVRGRQVRDVRPSIVVRHTPSLLALWIPPRTPVMRSVLADGRTAREAPLEERFRLPRTSQPDTWRGGGVLKLLPLGAAHSVWLFWNDDQASLAGYFAGYFAGYYVNLESPHVLWSDAGVRGIDTMDHALDLVVSPAGEVSWKDEDEFAVATGLPEYWNAEAAADIRAEGERVRARALAGHPPFDGSWLGFRPDPRWPVPVLPDGWDRPVAVPGRRASAVSESGLGSGTMAG